MLVWRRFFMIKKNTGNRSKTSFMRGGVGFGVVSLGLMTVSGHALALWNDQLELFVSEEITRDNNVYRLSKDEDARTILGTSRKSDTYTTTTAGLNLNLPVSLQRFQAGFSLSDVKYQHFGNLDNQGRDAYGTWLWQVGSQLKGHLGYRENKAQSSFSDIQGTSSNQRTTKRLSGNVVYAITPSWELQAGVAEQQRRNDSNLYQVNDLDTTESDASLTYVSRDDNRLGLAVRQEDGSFKNLQTVGGRQISNDYQQRSIGLVGDWKVSVKSRLRLRVDHVRRDYDQISGRDYSGTNFNTSYEWRPTAKLGLAASARREISSTEDTTTSFVLIKGVSLAPSLELSEKIRLSGLLDYSNRDYLGDSAQALGQTTSRTDHVRQFGLSLAWRPIRPLTVTLQGQYERRSSNVRLNDYTDTVYSLSARYAF